MGDRGRSRRVPRRTFVRRAAACGLLAGLEARWLRAAVDRATVRGTVLCGGAPRAGVRVSDGLSVATTDAAGAFALDVGPESGPFIFVTTPPGFWSAMFYVPAARAAAEGRADFRLDPHPQPAKFEFAFVTDIHLESGKAGIAKFKDTLAEINALGPAFVWAQGDICLESGMGRDYVECLAGLTMPVRNGAGNHEMLAKEPDPRAAFYDLFGPSWYSFDWAGVHCVVLDGRRLTAGSDWRAVRGLVGAAELAWLKADLAAVPAGMPVIAGIHIPLFSTGPERHYAPREDLGAWRVANAEEVHAVLAAHGTCLVLQGHVHENERIRRDGVEYVASQAVCGSWWRSGAGFERGVDRAPRGYRVVAVDGTAISHRFVASCESRSGAAGECDRGERELLPRRHARLIFNMYDGASWALGTATIEGAAAVPAAACAAVDPGTRAILPHHYACHADLSPLAPGRHRVRLDLDEGGLRCEAWISVAAPRPVPVLHLTDLFHPHDDPDDHIDLACLFGMRDIDLRGVVFDDGLRQKRSPGLAALKSPRDTGADQGAEFQGGVELILRTLRESSVPVTVTVVGSMRDIAAAWNRDPALCAAKIERLYIFIGDAHSAPGFGFREHNATLDPQAYAAIMRSGLPIFWVPCFDGGAWRNSGRASFWRASHRDLFAGVADPVKQYFIYALLKKTGDPLAFLGQPVDAVQWETVLSGTRNLWCAGVFAHIADRAFVREGGAWRSVPAAAGTASAAPFAFEPVRVNLDATGMALYPRELPYYDVQRFLIVDREAYDRALTAVTAAMLAGLGV